MMQHSVPTNKPATSTMARARAQGPVLRRFGVTAHVPGSAYYSTAPRAPVSPIPYSNHAILRGLTPSGRGVIQRACACGGTPGAVGECEGCRKKRLALQRNDADFREPAQVPPIVHEGLRSPGEPLDAATRAFFEPRFGHDFGSVRVHTDARAAESAKALNALAYTVGRGIVFGPGALRPETAQGMRLLGHELAHTIQQRAVGQSAGTGSATLDVASAADQTERDAHRVQHISQPTGRRQFLSTLEVRPCFSARFAGRP
jgi:hypothetical protein